MSPLNITQPLGIWSIIATIRWCPIFPKWDIYQPLFLEWLKDVAPRIAIGPSSTAWQLRPSVASAPVGSHNDVGGTHGGSIVMGVPLYRWMVYFMENPSIYNWLVVYLPLWKIWKSVGIFPIYGTIKHVPNHQANKWMIWGTVPPWLWKPPDVTWRIQLSKWSLQ